MSAPGCDNRWCPWVGTRWVSPIGWAPSWEFLHALARRGRGRRAKKAGILEALETDDGDERPCASDQPGSGFRFPLFFLRRRRGGDAELN